MDRIATRSIVLVSLSLIVLTGCGQVLRESDRYRTVGEHKALEVPPELDAPVTEASLVVPAGERPAEGIQPAIQPPLAPSELVAVDADGAPLDDRLSWQSGAPSLVLDDSVAGVYRRLGFALPRMGLDVVQANPTASSYQVRYEHEMADEDQPVLLSRLILRRKGAPDLSGRYNISVQADEGDKSRIVVTDEAGQPADADLAQDWLSKIASRLG